MNTPTTSGFYWLTWDGMTPTKQVVHFDSRTQNVEFAGEEATVRTCDLCGAQWGELLTAPTTL